MGGQFNIGYSLRTFVGTILDQGSLYLGTAAADRLSAAGFPGTIFSQEGDDIIVASATTSAVVIGGAGTDIVVMPFTADQYRFEDKGAHTLVSTAATQVDAYQIEAFVFADSEILFVEAPEPFNADRYLAANPDVAAAVAVGTIGAEEHWNLYGRCEGRTGANQFFDEEYYLKVNPDVAAAVAAGSLAAWQHYSLYGEAEGRSATSLFDNAAYLSANPDVAAAGMNPLDHWQQYGWSEGRSAYVTADWWVGA